jgi:TPR repeat protein
MGVVHRALDSEAGVEVALKQLRELSPQRLRRFEREARIASNLDHPGIVRVVSSGLHEGTPFIAYELVPQGNELGVVFQHAERQRRVELVRDTARALGYAHEHGVVHRDVKPANVLVDLAGQVRVTDFGLARGDELDRLTRSGAMVGTPTHMAPEQVRGDRHAVGPATDVWALGVILYEALTGQVPFRAASVPELMSSILAAEPASPRRVAGDVPRALEQVCLRALRPDPADRYPHGGAMADALEEALQSLRQEPQPRSASSVGTWLAGLLLGAGALAAGAIVSAGRSAPSPAATPSGSEASSSTAPTAASPAPPLPPAQTPTTEPADPSAPARGQHPLRAAAEAGDPRAMAQLGSWLLAPEREDRWVEGVEWLRRAAEAGDVQARVNLGVAYEKGQGVASDVERAITLYRSAADEGNAVGAYCLGTCLANHGGDVDEAIRWLERAAAGGERRAYNNLFALNASVRKDRQRANRWLRLGAEAGDPTCMANWGHALCVGEGVERDPLAGAAWYRRAAESGSPLGMHNWATVLERGAGVEQDQRAAIAWYSRALERGHAGSFTPLVRRLALGGPGLEPDHDEAVRWARLGEERGWPGSAFAMGMIYLNGWGGVARDGEAAKQRLELASSRGHPLATFELGRALIRGDLLQQDVARGRRLVERAAEMGSVEARRALERGIAAD